MIHTEEKLIAMQNDLGHGHKGDIILTTQDRVDNNLPKIAKNVLNPEYAEQLIRCWNAFNEDSMVDNLLAACKDARKWLEDFIECKAKSSELSAFELKGILHEAIVNAYAIAEAKEAQ